MYEEIIAEVDEQIGRLVLNRPDRKNALSVKMQAEIIDCLERWADDPAVSVVVLRGAGGVFSSGFDRDELFDEDAERHAAVVRSSERFHRAIHSFPKPLVAAVERYAIATAFDVAVLCDIRVAVEGTRFSKPEAKLGGAPIFTPLRMIVGDGWARDLVLTGRTIDAELALRIGLVTHLVPADELDATALSVARMVAEAPQEALRMTKRFFLADPDRETWMVPEHDDVFATGVVVRPEFVSGKVLPTA